MFAAYVVAAVVYGLLNVGTAVAKIRKLDRVTANLAGVGVPPSWFVPLGLLNLAGAVGLWIGIGWRPLGVAAATGLVLYFAGAVLSHVRVRDTKNLPMPVLLLLLGAGTLAIAVASL
ncbi:DoxX family protein [Actinoplanes sp. RD1]|uniref:DoxX family protein n=1 Tax=Actinoplanes sp. RD1 TaxID=3064538 RepID=UPI0027423D24|nr:DoxX family protein [Actinoplanes sp. RD1]